jgi:hypothetical protein
MILAEILGDQALETNNKVRKRSNCLMKNLSGIYSRQAPSSLVRR